MASGLASALMCFALPAILLAACAGAAPADPPAVLAATPKPAELKTFKDWTVGCDNGGAKDSRVGNRADAAAFLPLPVNPRTDAQKQELNRLTARRLELGI